MQLPLSTTIEGVQKIPKQQRWLNNLFPVINESGRSLVSRPACKRVKSLAVGQPRGLFEREGILFSVFGQGLYKNLDLEYVGEINGIGKVSTAKGFNATAIATGNSNYTLNNSLNEIADVDLPACASVSRVDGVYVWIPKDGASAIYSGVNNAGSIDPLDFFDAEMSADKNKLSLNVRNDLFIFGEESIERFRNTGSNGFNRVNNSIVSVGYISGLVETQDSFVFLGKDKDGGFKFFMFDGGQAVPVSTPSINEILNVNYTIDQLRAVEGQRFNWAGIDIYSFALPDKDLFLTFTGEGVKWGYLSSGTVGGWRSIERWGFRNATFFNGKWYCQRSDGLYEFTDDNSDQDGDFARTFSTFYRDEMEARFSFASLELSIAQMVDSGSMGLSVSRDGVLWSDMFFRPIGEQYDNRIIFRPTGGIGQFEGYAGFQLYTTSNVNIAIDRMFLQ